MYLALRGGPRRFTRAFPDPVLLGNTIGRSFAFVYGAVTLCGAPFQSASTSNRFCNSLKRLPSFQMGPTTPSQHRRQAVPLRRFGLIPFRSPLLRESQLLSFPRGTEMFQFPRFPSSGLCVQPGMTGHDPSRVSPFGDPRIKAWSTAPRGLSQPPTSFIGIWRQGIHRWLFLAWEFLLALFARCSCSLCSSQGTGRSLRQVRAAAQRATAPVNGGMTGGEEAGAPSQRNSERRATRAPVVPSSALPEPKG